MDRPYVCGIRGCQRRFKTHHNAEKHRHLHEQEGKYACFCGKRFVERSALSQHIKRHKLEQFCCNTTTTSTTISI